MGNEAILQPFHERHAGNADRVFGRASADDGRSSYLHLADRVPERASDVLDLACGDGLLLEILLGRGLRAVGLDRSRAELLAAQRRLPGAELREGRAEELPFAPARFDAVLCHMALMLMDDPAAALAEVRRVLRPGGRFAAAVGAGGPRPDEVARIFGILRELPEWAQVPRIAVDPRTRSEEGLRGLLGAPSWRGVEVRPLAVIQEVAASELPAFLGLMFYEVDALSDAGRTALAERLRAEVRGPVRWTSAMLLVSAEAA